MKRLLSIFMMLSLLLIACKEQHSTPEEIEETEQAALPPSGPIVVGYATYWDTTLPNATLLTHIVYSFAHIKGDFETLDIQNESRLKQIVALKKKNPKLTVQLSVGGWGAGNFSEMAASEKHRKQFCKNCLSAVKNYGLDGIDLDWEYPTSGVAGISHSPEDTRNFTLLLKDLREALGSQRLITMASADNAQYINFKDAIFYLNYVNVMTYNMGRPPYHNAGLYPSDKTEISCDESVALHYAAGVPYNKIVMGIPFFGRADGKAFGGEDEIDFKDIKTTGYNVCRDDKAKVPYLTDQSGTMVLSYDDETSVGLKADYIRQKGLLGAMYWNIEADDKAWTLSKAIATRLLEQ